jgi:hypothetical protein
MTNNVIHSKHENLHVHNGHPQRGQVVCGAMRRAWSSESRENSGRSKEERQRGGRTLLGRYVRGRGPLQGISNTPSTRYACLNARESSLASLLFPYSLRNLVSRLSRSAAVTLSFVMHTADGRRLSPSTKNLHPAHWEASSCSPVSAKSRFLEHSIGKAAFAAALFILLNSLFIGGFAATVHADITTGLVGHWKFDEGSGTTAGDSAGSNTGTLTNGPTWTTGKIGSGALSFDGTNEYVYRSSITGGSTTEGTYSSWLYYRSGTRFDGFITSNSNTPVIWDDGNNMRVRIDDGVGGYPINMSEPVDILLNQWVFWTITYDANGGTIYKNGTAVGSDGTGAASYAAISDMHIGSDKAIAGRTIDGVMDDVRLYNRALSASEITQLYLMGK